MYKTFAAVFFLTACVTTLPDFVFAQSPLHTISVNTGNKSVHWTIELASDQKSRAKGLMFVKTMAPDTGMLFRFETNAPISMWMKNTFIPLDMVFLSPSGKINHIQRDAVPQSPAIISSNGAVKFVLEINAGQANSSGLKVGQIMRHPWFSAAQ